MKIKYLIVATLVFFAAITYANTSGTYLYYVTQPEADAAEANTYIAAFEQMKNYKPTVLLAMMVNEGGAKIQAGLMATAINGHNYQLVCNFNIGNNTNTIAQDSYNAFKGNNPSICTGGFAIDYEPADTGANFHIAYFNQLIPLLRASNATAPIYLYFNPNQLLAYAQNNTTAFTDFVTFLAHNNVTMLWPVYSNTNAVNLNQLFSNYPPLQKLPYQLLFNILNASTVQKQILATLSADDLTNYNAAFWEVVSSINCPIGDASTCLTNLNASLAAFLVTQKL